MDLYHQEYWESESQNTYHLQIDNHQYENAKFLAEKNSAFICEEDLLEENLKKILFEIVKNPEILEKMKKNISRISLTDKKNMIVKKILSNE